MKVFLQTLLIALALGLCGLVAFQWLHETSLRKDVRGLTDQVQSGREAIQNLEQAVRRGEAEIRRLGGINNALTQTLKSNDVQIASLYRDLEKNQAENERLASQVQTYKNALSSANESIKKQNGDIRQQNEDMRRMGEERNDAVRKFNELARKHNDLVVKWNAQQAELAARNTNNPARNP